jgi:hypothetical protein
MIFWQSCKINPKQHSFTAIFFPTSYTPADNDKTFADDSL